MTNPLLARLEGDITAARRAGNQNDLLVLTLLISKVQRIAKDDGDRAITDTDVIQGVSRYRKEVDETKAVLETAGRSIDKEIRELEIVSKYLPQQISLEQLDQEIETALAGTARDKKAIGVVMKHLNGNFKGQFDPKAANAIITTKLA